MAKSKVFMIKFTVSTLLEVVANSHYAGGMEINCIGGAEPALRGAVDLGRGRMCLHGKLSMTCMF